MVIQKTYLLVSFDFLKVQPSRIDFGQAQLVKRRFLSLPMCLEYACVRHPKPGGFLTAQNRLSFSYQPWQNSTKPHKRRKKHRKTPQNLPYKLTKPYKLYQTINPQHTIYACIYPRFPKPLKECLTYVSCLKFRKNRIFR